MVKASLLSGVPLLASLSDAEFESIADKLREAKFINGDVIIEEGHINDRFYLIYEGEVVMSQRDEKAVTPPMLAEKHQLFKNQKLLNYCHPGDYFGESSLLGNNSFATRTVTAVGPVKCFFLTRDDFQMLVNQEELQKRPMPPRPEMVAVEMFLEGVPLLASATPAIRKKIAAILKSSEFADGTQILKEGKRSDAFYIVQQGQVLISLTDRNTGQEQTLAHLFPGDYFGEREMLSDSLVTANCTAVGDVKCWYATRKTFWDAFGTLEGVLRYHEDYYGYADQLQTQGVALPDFLEKRLESLKMGHFRVGYHWGHKLLSSDLIKTPADAVKMENNDYLCLVDDPQMKQAVANAIHAGGSVVASRVFRIGKKDVHAEFEHRVSKLCHCEAAVLTQSGYSANFGLMLTICSKDIPMYIDVMAHASLQDYPHTARFGNMVHMIPHNSLQVLEQMVVKHGPGYIIVDSLYSTDGSVCPLLEVLDISERFGCMLVVDECHAFGCAKGGLGLCEELGISARVGLRTLGLSKAFAQRGGLVLGPARIIEAFRHTGRQMIFSTGSLDHEVAGYNKALDIFLSESWRQEKLKENHATLKRALLDLGYAVERSDRQIISIVTGEDRQTMVVRDALASLGVIGAVFCPPATPVGKSMIRFTVNCNMTKEDIEKVIHGFAQVRSIFDNPFHLQDQTGASNRSKL